MALTGLLILASGFFLVSLAVLPGVNHRIRGVTSAGVYYGWWVLAACCLLALFTGGIFYRGFTVFFLPIQREFNLSRASTSLIFSLATAEGGVGGPFVGWLIDRLGSRPLILVGGLLAGIGFMVLSFVNGYFSFLIVYVGIVSVGISTCLDPSLMTAVNRWFLRRKAIALATMLTSYTLGGALLTPLLAFGVQRVGWRDVVLIAGGFICLIVIPLGMLVRRSPESAGIVLEGSEDRQRSAVRDDRPEPLSADHDFSVREAVRTRTYWTLLAASALRIGVNSSVVVHLIPMMVWKGMDETSAAGLTALLFSLSIPGRLLSGVLADRFPVQPILFGGMISGGVSMLVLAIFEGSWVPYLFIVGLATLDACSPLGWIALGSFFGRQSFATLLGIMSVFYSLGMLLFPVYAGWVFDVTGSYEVVAVTFALLYAISAALFATIRRPRTVRPTPAV